MHLRPFASARAAACCARILCLLLSGALAGGLSGCRKPPQKTPEPGYAVQPRELELPPASPVPSDAPADAQAADVQGDAAAGPPPDGAEPELEMSAPGVVNMRPSNAELAGDWFALFGLELGGLSLFSWEDQRLIRFLPDGRVIWTPAAAEAQSGKSGLQSRFGALVTLAQSPGQGGWPSDEEASTPESLGLKIASDKLFLVLSDGDQRMTVYGRVENKLAEIMPLFVGTWYASVQAHTLIETQVTNKTGQLEIAAADGSVRFSGRPSHGYYVGEAHTPDGDGIAAVTVRDGMLTGVFAPEPYSYVGWRFYFKPRGKQ